MGFFGEFERLQYGGRVSGIGAQRRERNRNGVLFDIACVRVIFRPQQGSPPAGLCIKGDGFHLVPRFFHNNSQILILFDGGGEWCFAVK